MVVPRPSLKTVGEKIGPASHRPRVTASTGVLTPPEDIDVEDPIAVGAKGVLEMEDDDDESKITFFVFLKIYNSSSQVTALSALYMAGNPWLFFYDPDKGEICPYTVICATNTVEMVLLTGSRISAGVLFASLTISIFSKCYATRSFLHHSWLGAVIDFEPSHDIHTYFGYLSLMAAFEHGILHCIRFAHAKQEYLVWKTDTGRSGVVGCVLLLPIVLPMRFEVFRTKMAYQFRKILHMLFLPLLAALCFHSKMFRFVGSILLVWYILDRFYYTTKQTFLIDHPVFEAVGRGTMVILDLPPGYTFKAGSYIYVNSPMISPSEWHPFSIMQVPDAVPRAAFYAEAVSAREVGDWTQDLFRLGLKQPRLPLWITAAQPSLMEKSIYYDNVVLVCTGAGITPAVSIIERFSKRKNIHLVWMTRDGGMVALFEKQLRQVKSTVHLTGTPTEETKEALKRLLQPAAANHEATGVMTRRSFSSIANDVFNKLGAPGSPKSMDASEDGAEEMKDEFDMGDLPVFPRKSHVLRRSTGQMLGSIRRSTSKRSVIKPTNSVTLVFGRPDIAAYLTKTFAMKSGAPCPEGATVGGGAWRPSDTSVSVRDMKSAAGLAQQRTKRLNQDQEVSKETLMKADAKVVQACQDQRSKIVKGSLDGSGSFSQSLTSGCPLPWLVLYCGANPTVEEALGLRHQIVKAALTVAAIARPPGSRVPKRRGHPFHQTVGGDTSSGEKGDRTVYFMDTRGVGPAVKYHCEKGGGRGIRHRAGVV
eukprot:jgi/Undpi1/2141/HiC_scaffold_12.g05527.m1